MLEGERIRRFEGYAFLNVHWSDLTNYHRFLAKLMKGYMGDTIRWVSDFWIIVWALSAAKLASETGFTIPQLWGHFFGPPLKIEI